MIDLLELKARIARLEKLERGLAAEIAVWTSPVSPLLNQGELISYLSDMERARSAPEEARQILAAAVKRIDHDRRFGRR